MTRREFITLLGGAAAMWPVVTCAQELSWQPALSVATYLWRQASLTPSIG
jgi:hypothetical protein